MRILGTGIENCMREWYFLFLCTMAQFAYLVFQAEGLIQSNSSAGIRSCTADLIVLESGASYLGIFSMPLFLFFLYRCERYAMETNQIIRFHSRICLWQCQAGRMFACAAWFTAAFALFPIIVGKTAGLPFYTWDIVNSSCFLDTGLVSQLNFGEILTAGILFNFSRLCMIGLAALWLFWKGLHAVWGFVLIACLAASDYAHLKYFGFYRIFGMDYKKAVDIRLLAVTAAAGVILAALLYLAGHYTAGKKEFINVINEK